MIESRCGAVFSENTSPVLRLRAEYSLYTLKPAHSSRLLPRIRSYRNYMVNFVEFKIFCNTTYHKKDLHAGSCSQV
jgi:hypothetical protein